MASKKVRKLRLEFEFMLDDNEVTVCAVHNLDSSEKGAILVHAGNDKVAFLHAASAAYDAHRSKS